MVCRLHDETHFYNVIRLNERNRRRLRINLENEEDKYYIKDLFEHESKLYCLSTNYITDFLEKMGYIEIGSKKTLEEWLNEIDIEKVNLVYFLPSHEILILNFSLCEIHFDEKGNIIITTYPKHENKSKRFNLRPRKPFSIHFYRLDGIYSINEENEEEEISIEKLIYIIKPPKLKENVKYLIDLLNIIGSISHVAKNPPDFYL
jgi:hypothetical protein